ncbi:MAG TPA: AMP-binding protein, partial [Mycobacteriales bacterium]|nr:AMP-binding protein [Mycobacteriales bacterium]
MSGRHRWSYQALDSAVDRLADGLRRLALVPGDRVVVHLPNTPGLVTLSFALFRLGVLPVLVPPAQRANEVVRLCETAEPVAYVVPDEHGGVDYRELAATVRSRAPTLRHVLVDGAAGPFTSLAEIAETGSGTGSESFAPSPASVAMLLPSGGTTGSPKLIPRTHQDYAYNVRASARLCGFDETTVYLAALPVTHNFALGCPGALGTWYMGGKVVLSTDPTPGAAFEVIRREGVTVTALVPPLALLWIEEAEWSGSAPASLRLVQVGGSRFGAEHARRLRPALGCPLQQVYGMAEGLLSYTRLDDPEESIVSTQGRPLSPADEVRVVDEHGRNLDTGEMGELLVRGPYTVRGYYRAPEYDAQAFTADGFYRTGDLARLTPTGRLRIEGRRKDVINRGGEKVPAEEVENHLLAHPLVADVALVAMPDAHLGERTCAFVVARNQPPTLSELAAFLRER